MEDSFEKVTFRNNWESHEYYVNGRRVKLHKVTILNKEYFVEKKVVSVPYEDWGRTYYAESLHHFVKDNFGAEVSLSKIRHDILVKKGDYVTY